MYYYAKSLKVCSDIQTLSEERILLHSHIRTATEYITLSSYNRTHQTLLSTPLCKSSIWIQNFHNIYTDFWLYYKCGILDKRQSEQFDFNWNQYLIEFREHLFTTKELIKWNVEIHKTVRFPKLPKLLSIKLRSVIIYNLRSVWLLLLLFPNITVND